MNPLSCPFLKLAIQNFEHRRWCSIRLVWKGPTLTNSITIIDIERRKNRLLKFCYVPTTSAAHNRLLFFFWLRPFTVLMKQTRAVKQSIFLDVCGLYRHNIQKIQINFKVQTKKSWYNSFLTLCLSGFMFSTMKTFWTKQKVIYTCFMIFTKTWGFTESIENSQMFSVASIINISKAPRHSA